MICSFYFYPNSLINWVIETITLFIVDPYLIRIVSGSSSNTSDPGKSKNVILDNNIRGSLVSLSTDVYTNSIVKKLVALFEIFPNSLLELFLFFYPLYRTSPN